MARRIWNEDHDEESSEPAYRVCRHRAGDPNCDCDVEDEEPEIDDEGYDDDLTEETEGATLLSELG